MAEFKKASIGTRGKWAEKEVEAVLKAANQRIYGFAYERLPDARAAGGRLKASICDFLAWWKGPDGPVSYMIEAKELAHDYRLPKDKIGQLARMRKVANAGGVGIVLVYHTTSSMWRGVPLAYLDGEIPPSWDLRDVKLWPTPLLALQHCGFPDVRL